MMLFCGWRGAMLSPAPGHNEADKRARNYLFPFWNARFEQWTKQYGEGFLFHRYTLLWLMRHALTWGDPNGVRLNTPDQFATFGETCLIANDLSAFENPKPLPTDLAVAANMLPNTEYFSNEDHDRDVARTHYLLTGLARDAENTKFRQFATRIQELLGYEITAYCDLSLASAMKTLAADTTSPEAFQLPTIAPQHFSTTSISPTDAATFLQSIGSDEDEFSRAIADSKAHKADLTVFRDKPMLRFADTFATLDVGFVLDKAGRSLFWTALKNSNDNDERERLLAQWGELIELYMNDLLGANLGQQSMLLSTPIFANKAQACDALVLEGNTLMFLECKANTIKSAIRYADDPKELAAILETRFVTGGREGRKGLMQLFHAIKRFSGGDSLIDPSSGTTIRPDMVTRIMPVLVHLDNALRTPGIPHYLQVRFKALGRIKKYTLLPLTTLPITELEELEGHLREYGLSTLLESFLGQLGADRTRIFLTRTLPVLRGQLRKPGTTLQRFDAYLDGLQRRLFPNEPQQAALN